MIPFVLPRTAAKKPRRGSAELLKLAAERKRPISGRHVSRGRASHAPGRALSRAGRACANQNSRARFERERAQVLPAERELGEREPQLKLGVGRFGVRGGLSGTRAGETRAGGREEVRGSTKNRGFRDMASSMISVFSAAHERSIGRGLALSRPL